MPILNKKSVVKDKVIPPQQILGKMGESAVEKLLISKGFTLIEANYRQKCGEIDLIMAKNEIVSFFEVKTVSRERFVPPRLDNSSFISRETYRPEENVHSAKLRRIGKTVRVWLARHGLDDSKEWNFNVACVYFSRTEQKFRVHFLWDIVL